MRKSADLILILILKLVFLRLCSNQVRKKDFKKANTFAYPLQKRIFVNIPGHFYLLHTV
jgi:hypothetical protein